MGHEAAKQLDPAELAEVMQARVAASRLLIKEGVIDRQISLVEALTMRAVVWASAHQTGFYIDEITEVTGRSKGSVYNSLATLNEFGLLTSSMTADLAQDRKTRWLRFYEPTELGSRVFGLFAPEAPENLD